MVDKNIKVAKIKRMSILAAVHRIADCVWDSASKVHVRRCVQGNTR